jgi:hypothetical protein
MVKVEVMKDDIFNRGDSIDESFLREDMYQATCKEYVIDCGWYENDMAGNFITFLIHNQNWDYPMIRIVTRNISDARWSVNVCKEYLNKII